MSLKFLAQDKVQLYLKVLIEGSSGTGKSHTSLLVANAMCKELGISQEKDKEEAMIIDSEYGRILKKPKEMRQGFKYGRLDKPTLADYKEALIEAYKLGVKLIIFDSFSHAYADYKLIGQQNGGSYSQWGKANERYDELMETLNRAPMHVIATSRLDEKIMVNQEEIDGRTKTTVVKLGLNPELKKNTQYDFDLRIRMDIRGKIHVGEVIKDNNHWGLQNEEFQMPGEKFGKLLAVKIKGE